MTDNVLDFLAAQNARQQNKPVSQGRPATVQRLETNQEIFQEIFEDVIAGWQAAAAKNKLNEYVQQRIPAHARGADNADYLNDLNVISNVECKLDMQVSMFYPGTTPSNKLCWLVGFHRGKETYSAPPDMVSESYARSLNILLFVAFERRLKRMNRS